MWPYGLKPLTPPEAEVKADFAFASPTLPLTPPEMNFEAGRAERSSVAPLPSVLEVPDLASMSTMDSHGQACDAPAALTAAEVRAEEKAQKRKVLVPFAIISISYLLFTMTDGSVRMIVLLHAYNKRFTAMEVAIMFTLYELAGVFTNILAGIAGAKWGIRYTLLVGLHLQFVGLALLFAWQDSWSKLEAIIYVTVAQMLCGIAKDLTKLGGKTVTKLVTPEEKQGRLFKLVSYITGFKNSLKGVGYFICAVYMKASDTWGLFLALGVNVFLIAAAIPWAYFGLTNQLGTKSSNVTLYDALLKINYNLSQLSLACLFLFASRDLWFEVPLPFFLRSPGCNEVYPPTQCNMTGSGPGCPGGTYCGLPPSGAADVCLSMNDSGGCGGLGLSRVLVGTFLALYIIVYGQMQAFTPDLVLSPLRQSPPNKYVEIVWGFLNCLPTAAMAGLCYTSRASRSTTCRCCYRP